MGTDQAMVAAVTHLRDPGPHPCSFWPRRNHSRTSIMDPIATRMIDRIAPGVVKRSSITRGLRRSSETPASQPTP